MTIENIDTCGIVAGNVLDLNFGTSKITGDVASFNTITGSGAANISGITNTGGSINTVLANASYLYSQFIAMTPDTTSGTSNIAGMTFNPGINALTNASISI